MLSPQDVLQVEEMISDYEEHEKDFVFIEDLNINMQQMMNLH